jgi:hypothetical protein
VPEAPHCLINLDIKTKIDYFSGAAVLLLFLLQVKIKEKVHQY